MCFPCTFLRTEEVVSAIYFQEDLRDESGKQSTNMEVDPVTEEVLKLRKYRNDPW